MTFRKIPRKVVQVVQLFGNLLDLNNLHAEKLDNCVETFVQVVQLSRVLATFLENPSKIVIFETNKIQRIMSKKIEQNQEWCTDIGTMKASLKRVLENPQPYIDHADYLLSYLKLENEDLLTARLHKTLTNLGISCFHVPNGGLRNKRVGNTLKAMGTTAGVFDLCIMLPESRVMWLELKDGKKGYSDNQKKFKPRYEQLNHVHDIAYSFEHALKKILEMLDR